MRESSFRFADHRGADATNTRRIEGFRAGRLAAPATKRLTKKIVGHVPQVARTLAVGEARPVDPSAQGTRLTFLGLVLAPGALCVKQISGARLVPTYTRLLDGVKLDRSLIP